MQPAPCDAFYLYHPVTREFIIGQKSKMIYSRQEYNLDGNLMWKFEYKSIELNPDWRNYPDLFSTPKDIIGRVSNEVDCMQILDKQKNNSFYKRSNFNFSIMNRVKSFFLESLA